MDTQVSTQEAPTGDLMIYDEIGMFGISAQNIADQLKGRKGPLTCRLNSPGGDVFDGLAIYNLIRAYQGDVTMCIDGIAASMASVIACAGSKVVISEGALWMMHNPAGLVLGEASDMRQMADVLDTMKRTLIAAYVRRSGKTSDEIAALMDAETWLTGAEAVAAGFADRCGKPVPLSAKWSAGKATAAWNRAPDDLSRFTHLPATPPSQERPDMSTKTDPAAQPAQPEGPSLEALRAVWDTAQTVTGCTDPALLRGALLGLKAKADQVGDATARADKAEVSALVDQAIRGELTVGDRKVRKINATDRAHFAAMPLGDLRGFLALAPELPALPTAAPQDKGLIAAGTRAASPELGEFMLNRRGFSVADTGGVK